MNFKKLKNRILAAMMAVSILLGALPITAFGAPFTKNGNILSNGSIYYYLNDVGGVKAYIPLQYGTSVHDADSIKRAMTNEIGVTSTEGSLAETAAFRYQGFGARYANLVKYASKDGLTTSGRWYLPPFDIGQDVNLLKDLY